ncbi:MAG: NADH:ubiquinone oxidoreductase [Candidatus Cloacimonetes bacterium]|nr:NADH:ubiquinone oxidoreductase [Candidatus Cloacimonadota bacterium]
MFELLKARILHGYQAIPDPLKAKINQAFPGVPRLSAGADLAALAKCCPVNAISDSGLDLGRCIFCGKCQRLDPEAVSFEADFRLAADSREKLIIRPGQQDYPETSIQTRLPRQFRRSFALRNVSAAGCNACELELGACSNVNFDMGRYGIEVVASPRHADALILTGPISQNMEAALYSTWDAIPGPRFLILSGACAISGGIFAESDKIRRSFASKLTVTLYIPGCPAHPLSIIHGLVTLMRGR